MSFTLRSPKNISPEKLSELADKSPVRCLDKKKEVEETKKKCSYKSLEKLLKNNFHRNDCLISVGGGITGDVSGFASSVYKRGIKFVNFPTTLLSQVDSSGGGKTGVNLEWVLNCFLNDIYGETIYNKTKIINEVKLNFRQVLHIFFRIELLY